MCGEKKLQNLLTRSSGRDNFIIEMEKTFSKERNYIMTDYIIMQTESNEKLFELIKQVIGNRTLRKVEEEAGISHGLLGKVLKGTQKASVDLLQKLTAKESNPQNDVTYEMLMVAANYISFDILEEVKDPDDYNARMFSYADKLNLVGNPWVEKVMSEIKEKYGIKDSDIVSVQSAVAAFKKSVCSDVIVTDKSGKKIWVSFLYDNGKAMADRIIHYFSRIAFAGADKYLVAVNTMKALQTVEQAKQSLRKGDFEIVALLVEE